MNRHLLGRVRRPLACCFSLALGGLAACGGGSGTHGAIDAAALDSGATDAAADGGPDASPTPDPSFGDHGQAVVSSGRCERLAVSSGDKVVLSVVDSSGEFLVRYGADGQPDATFGLAGRTVASVAPSTPGRLYVLPDGKLLMTGFFATGGSNLEAHLARFTADGNSDGSFGTSGRVVLPGVSDILAAGARAGGGLDLVAIGGAAQHAFNLLRLDSAGALDPSFGTGGISKPLTSDAAPGYFPHAVSLGNGRFVVSGAGFSAFNDAGQQGPVNAQLFLVADGAIITTRATAPAYYLDLSLVGDHLYSLRQLADLDRGQVDRWSPDLTQDSSFAVVVPTPFSIIGGLATDGLVAARSDGALMAVGWATQGGKTFFDRFAPDGTLESSAHLEDLVGSSSKVGVCGLAFDSRGRPLVGVNESTAHILRLGQ